MRVITGIRTIEPRAAAAANNDIANARRLMNHILKPANNACWNATLLPREMTPR